ncbi:MAG: TetR/AcrR family transcriptional regulator [Chromatiaceae bacterium]|nr:TetR/AcrR family transcriptional regulator [Chromatiaceae bacterium]
MARRSDHSRDQIHEMALSATERIVGEQGYQGLSARKVAGAIGYTVGTLYLVFDNLDDLILQVNGRTLDRLYARMVQEQAKQKQAKERLLQLGHSYIQFACEEPHTWQMIFEHRLTGEREIPEWFQLKVARMFALVETGLEPLAAQHSPGEIALAARALWSGVHGVCILAVSDKLDVVGVESVQNLTDLLVGNFLKGFMSS